MENLPVFIICKQNKNATNGYKDFRLRQDHIMQWLTFLKANNPHYAHIQIDNEAVDQIPVNGDVTENIQVIYEEELDEEEENEDAVNKKENRPEQGGATGENYPDHDNVHEGYIAAPTTNKHQTENKILRQVIHDRLTQTQSQARTDNTTVPWPQQGNRLNDLHNNASSSNVLSNAVPLWRRRRNK